MLFTVRFNSPLHTSPAWKSPIHARILTCVPSHVIFFLPLFFDPESSPSLSLPPSEPLSRDLVDLICLSSFCSILSPFTKGTSPTSHLVTSDTSSNKILCDPTPVKPPHGT